MSIARLAWCFVPLILAVVTISLLEEKMNRWFSPFTASSPGVAASVSPSGNREAGRAGSRVARELCTSFKVVLDPGHGGRAERRSATTGDNWDPELGEFLSHYLSGGMRTHGKVGYSEQEIVLALSKRVKLLLDKTLSDRSWPQFEGLVRGYQELSKSPVRRVRIASVLARENSYLDHPEASTTNANRFFRLFDSPESFPATPATRVVPGRLSKIIAEGPDLVVALHINDSSVQSVSGYTALFVPPFEFFEDLRQMLIGARPWKDLRFNPYYLYWAGTRGGRHRREDVTGEVNRYFLDSGSGTGGHKGKGGSRLSHITWRYRDTRAPSPVDLRTPPSGAFWERERSKFEGFRRGGGPEEIGGDNLYAGQELIRFVRYALWKNRLEQGSQMPPEVELTHAHRSLKKASTVENKGAVTDARTKGSKGPKSRGASDVSKTRREGDAGAKTAFGSVASEPHTLPTSRASEGASIPVADEPSPDLYLGRQLLPIGSDWALPWFSNSVTAYLEMAYLSNPGDLWLLDNKLDVMAEGLAVGIYALTAGLKVKSLTALEAPRGLRIDWEQYRETPWGGTYVEVARQAPAR